jgi:uncharacterized membrane protein
MMNENKRKMNLFFFVFFFIIYSLFCSILRLLLITNTALHYFSSLLISPFQLVNINMKLSAVIAIVVIAVVASLAMVDATPVLDCRAPQPPC